MEIQQLEIDKIFPYKNNPRRNEKAVEYVANSIRSFGFRNPIILDKDHVIICGHTRFLAAKSLGYAKVPCLICEDMDPDKVKAFRLADNKVAEFSQWDKGMLEIEIEQLCKLGIAVDDFGFEFTPMSIDVETDIQPDDGYYGDERERTNRAYNLKDFNPGLSVGFYQIPMLEKCNHVPEHIIDFNSAVGTVDEKAGVHFFIDDYRFERVWNQPEKYVEILKRFDCVFTPDFSLYLDMPMAMKIWNVYRSRLIGQIMQCAGLNVIPTVSWAEPETYTFCFDGIPEGGTVATSTVGVMRDKASKKIFMDGMAAMIDKVKPSMILMYGKAVPEACGGVEFKSYEDDTFGLKFAGRTKKMTKTK